MIIHKNASSEKYLLIRRVGIVNNDILRDILCSIKQGYKQVYGDDIMDIYLYGSYARGDYEQDSDIDFVAIVKGNRLDLQKKLKFMWDIAADLGLENDIVISPTVIPYNEFLQYQEKLPYYRNIIKEGVKVG